MADFSDINLYTNRHAWRSFFATLLAFVAWWLAILAHGLFGGLLKRRRTMTTAGRDPYAASGPRVVDTTTTTNTNRAVDGPNWHSKTGRIRDALTYLTLSMAITVFLNYHVNGITKGFEILTWVVLVLGILWAVGRGLVKRFADGLLLLIIPLFLAMWGIALRGARYVPRAVLV